MLSRLHHVNILSADMEATAAFYEKLGFMIGPRPAGFPEPGIWLYVGVDPVLHINPSSGPRANPGDREADLKHAAHWLRTVDHFGFAVRGSVEQVTERLDAVGIKYDLWDPIPGVNRALYFEDPTTGAKIEYVLVDEYIPLAESA